jgi:hypothetical protein
MLDLGLAAAMHYAEPRPFDPAPASPFTIHTTFALQAVASIFAVYELTERAIEARERDDQAKEDSTPTWRGEDLYPTAEQRWKSFRACCVEKLEVPDEMFTHFNGIAGAANDTFDRFLHVTRNIKWRSG